MSAPALQLLRREETAEAAEARREHVASLLERARRGALPRRRALKPWEPETLNEVHINMVMMRAAGVRQGEIARLFQTGDSRVSVVLNHPDAEFILNQLQGLMGAQVTDIDGRLRALTERAVDAIEEVFDCDDPKQAGLVGVKARVGFALLERNGLGAKREVHHEHDHRLQVDDRSAGLLVRALRETREIEDGDYVEVGSAPGGPPSAALLSGPEATGAPPSSGPQEHPSPSSSEDNQ